MQPTPLSSNTWHGDDRQREYSQVRHIYTEAVAAVDFSQILKLLRHVDSVVVWDNEDTHLGDMSVFAHVDDFFLDRSTPHMDKLKIVTRCFKLADPVHRCP